MCIHSCKSPSMRHQTCPEIQSGQLTVDSKVSLMRSMEPQIAAPVFFKDFFFCNEKRWVIGLLCAL